MDTLFRIIFSVFLTFLIAEGKAQVKFYAEIFPETVNKGELITLKYIIENPTSIEHVYPPSLSNFQLISGPNQETGVSIINGVTKKTFSIAFTLRCLKSGKFNILPATATIGGKEYNSNKVVLTVKNQGSSIPSNVSPVNPFTRQQLSPDYVIRKGETVQDKVQQNMKLRLEVDKTSCYVGEPIVATYKLYSRLKSESKLSSNPSFNGFSVIELQDPDVSETSVAQLDGREFNSYVIRKARLYPLQPGEIEIESAELENLVHFIKAPPASHSQGFHSYDHDILYNPSFIEKVILKSKPVTITVKPLPTTGRPAGFKGAIGSFNIQATMEKYVFPSNSEGKFIIDIKGEGNLQLINGPDVRWPEGIEGFEPKVSEQLNPSSTPLGGHKQFVYSFSADSAGSYNLPEVQFHFFDPEKESYQTVVSEPVSFTVLPASNIEAASSASDAITNKNPRGYSLPIYVLLGISLLLLVGLLVFRKQSNNKAKVIKPEPEVPIGNETKAAEALITENTDPLSLSSECILSNDCSNFYAVLNAEFKSFLSSRLCLSANELSIEVILKCLDEKNISNNTALEVEQLLKEIEWQLYTPFEKNSKMEDIFRRANEMVQQVNSYFSKRQ